MTVIAVVVTAAAAAAAAAAATDATVDVGEGIFMCLYIYMCCYAYFICLSLFFSFVFSFVLFKNLNILLLKCNFELSFEFFCV